MPNSVDLRAQRATDWAAARALIDAGEAENRDLSAAEREQYERIETEMDALTARIERQEKLEATRPTADTKQPIETPEQRDDRPSEAAIDEAFRQWMRFGPSQMTPEQRSVMAARNLVLNPELRALSTLVDTAGGYLVPEGFRARIENAMKEFGGMRRVATTFATEGGGDLAIPTSDDTSNTGERIGENTTVSEQDVTVGQRIYRAYMYSSKIVKVSLALIQDAAFDLDTWLADKLGERIGRILNSDLTSYAGADGPSGITVDATAGVTAAATTAVVWDELINLEHTVDPAYRERGRYMFHDNTLRDLRKLKDGNGAYLWQPGTRVGEPDSINRFPYTVNMDMPQMTTGLRAIVFGDLSKYLIRDVRGITLLTLRERFADSLQVAFLAFSRHDGKLLDAGTNPVKVITMA